MKKWISVSIIILLCIFLGTTLLRNDFKEVEQLYNSGQKYQAAIKCYSLENNKKDAFQKSFEIWDELTSRSTVATGAHHSVAVLDNSSVLSTVYIGDPEYYEGQCEVTDWNGIVAIAAGEEHTVGLKADGTVVATGENEKGQCEVSNWSGIVNIAANGFHTVGLKGDGTVIAVGETDYGRCQISSWENIVGVSAGYYHTVGLKDDGTVIATTYTGIPEWYSGQCEVSNWKNITQVSAGREHTVGLKSDGTVVATGANNYGQCNVYGWEDIVYISAGWFNTIGVKADGTVVATGIDREKDYGQSNVGEWNDIVVACASYKHTIGLKADGTMIATIPTRLGDNYHGQVGVDEWTGISTHSNKISSLEDDEKIRDPYSIGLVGEWYCSPSNSCNDMSITIYVTREEDMLIFERSMQSSTSKGSSDLTYSAKVQNTESIYCEETSAIYSIKGNYLYEVFDNGRQNKYIRIER